MSMSWVKFRVVYTREAMLDVGGRWWLYWSTRFQVDFSIEVRKYSLLLIYSGYINLSSYERFISLIFSPTSQNVWSQTHRNISFRITSKIRVDCRVVLIQEWNWWFPVLFKVFFLIHPFVCLFETRLCDFIYIKISNLYK